MRVCIKGDGTDGTAALKEYLATHDEVLAQELYEFSTPALAGLSVPLYSDATALSVFAPTTHGSFVPSSEVIVPSPPSIPPLPYGAAFADVSSGYMLRTTGSAFAGFFQPGDLYWDYAGGALYGAPGADAPFARPRSEISRIFAVMVAYSSGGGSIPLFEGEASIDGGATFSIGILPSLMGSYTTPTTFQSGIQDAGGMGWLPGGDIIGFDFTQIKFHVACGSNGNPGELFLVKIGLRFEFRTAGAAIGAPSSTKYFTDSNSPLTYAGRAYAPGLIKNDGFKSKIGLDVDALKLDWKFRGDEPLVVDPDTNTTLLTALQGFQQGLWSGVWVKWRRAYMPTFGDCDSLGAVSMFRGRIAEVEVDRLTAKITVNSVTEMFNRNVPQQLIEANNRALQIGPGLPPDLNPDPAHWTYFTAEDGHGGTVQKIVAAQTAPTADVVYAPGTFDLGYLLIALTPRLSSPIEHIVAQVQRYEVVAGFNVFYLFRPLFLDPHVYGLTFAAFVSVPKDQNASGVSGLELQGFPFVPLPEQAV